MGGAAVLDEGASIALVAHLAASHQEECSPRKFEIRASAVQCAVCSVVSCLGHNLATWFFYYVPREHTNVLHARSSLGAAAPGAAGVRIPPPSEEGGGGGREREGGGGGRGSTSAKRDSRDADGELHARLRAALAPAVATHELFFS